MMKDRVRSWLNRTLAIVLMAIVAGAFSPGTSLAATLRVALDGSGDYTSLFDALAAAQNGDTVSIAPGEYTETRWINPYGINFESMGLVYASNVTVIGDDRDTVLIGPPVQPDPLTDNGVRGIGSANGAVGVVFEQLTLRNLSKGIIDGTDAPTVRNCRFLGNDLAIAQIGLGRFEVTDCDFVSNHSGIIPFGGYGTRQIFISGCNFWDSRDEAMQIQNPDTEVADCVISGGSFGIGTTLGGQLLLHDTIIRDTSRQGLHASSGSIINMYSCIFKGTMEHNLWSEFSQISAQAVDFQGGTISTLYFVEPFTVDMFSCHILNAGGLSVFAFADLPDPRTISLKSNWWGTADINQVEAWIDHAPDDPGANAMTVEYSPIVFGVVPTDNASMGQLKSRYSGGD